MTTCTSLRTVVRCPKCGNAKFHKDLDGSQCWYCSLILYDEKPMEYRKHAKLSNYLKRHRR